MLFFSCGGKKAETKPVVEPEIQEEEIINAVTINSNPDTLFRTYNNTKGTLVIAYKGDTVQLQRDTMASGIKYSNGKYVMTEWHGETELKKDGRIIFRNPVTD